MARGRGLTSRPKADRNPRQTNSWADTWGEAGMRYLTLVSAMTLLPALSASAAKPVGGQGDAASCAALAGKTIAPDTVIQSAEYLAEGGTVGTTKVTAAFCRVIGIATPVTDSHIGFEVWLPPAAQWNGKFRGEGSGGSAGAISPGPTRDAL